MVILELVILELVIPELAILELAILELAYDPYGTFLTDLPINIKLYTRLKMSC
jgi:hypothetical protein